MIGTASAERILLLSTVAREGSMTAAAESAGYSVSAISQQIRKLELEAGVPLLQRHSRGIFLTDAGRAVVEHAERIQGQMKSLQHSLDDIIGLRSGTLRMGTFPTAGSSLLPAAISGFRKAHPFVELTVRSFRKVPLLNMLTNRDISMSLLWEYPWSRIDHPNLDLVHLMDDPTDLVVSHNHPMAERESVSVSELVDEVWVIRAEKHPVMEAIIRASNKVGFEPKVAYEANDYQEAQAMVAVGLGVALVPRLALSVQRSDVKVIPLTGIVPRRRIMLARLADGVPNPAELAMVKMLIEAAQDLSSAGQPRS
ncbi:LysR family transcriptional regulator [Paramicrobacterium agarici]|uniref:Molybdate transport repressor ModE-like protein n=1 Tax=Paramicrobacterium agarici TaxID=630514 RepID=A0A2A9DSQ0_9MICO|nr:LysR family transcriptional regulator [Microbacterium agarici]PFG29817.1 molybdate transport repressor ModE-like protein [Microbacterium agarici]